MARKSSAVVSPNLGLYLDRPAIAVPPRGLQDGYNFRIKEGTITNRLLGWTRFSDFTLNGPVRLIDNFFLRDGTEHLIFGSLDDLYRYDVAGDEVLFLTPVYDTGTVDVDAADPAVVTGTGTTWTTNVTVGDQISFGAADENDPAATWYTVAIVTDNTHLTLGSAVAGAPLTGVAYTIRKILHGTLLDHWDTATFLNEGVGNDDHWYATNGVDNVVRWNGTDPQAVYLSSLGFNCKHLVVFSNMMIYLNLIQGGVEKPTDIINSAVGLPEDVVGGLSGQFTVHGGPEPILEAQPLGDNLAIYSEDRRITLVQFLGDPLVFAFRQVSSTVGPVAQRVVADFGDFHEFLAPDAQYRFDGATLQTIGMQVWREVIVMRDPVRIALAFSHFDEENGDLLWVLPLQSDPGAEGGDVAPADGFSEHYLEEMAPGEPQPFGKRSMPFTASGYFQQQGGTTWETVEGTWDDVTFRWNDQFFFSNFPLNMVGDINGKVYTLNASETADGTALASYVVFGRRPMGDGRMRGLLARVYPFAFSPSGGSYDLEVRLGLTEHASGTATFTSAFPLDLTLPEGGHFVSTFRRARYYDTRFGTPGPSQPYVIEGFDIDLKPGGRR